MHFIFIEVLKNLKSFSENNVLEHALDIFIENGTRNGLGYPIKRKQWRVRYHQNYTIPICIPIQCNGNYRIPSRNEYNAFGYDGYRFP